MKKLIGLLSVLFIFSSCNGVTPQTNTPIRQAPQVVKSDFKGSVKIIPYPDMDKAPVYPNEDITLEIIPKINNPEYTKLVVDFGDNAPLKYIDLAYGEKGPSKVNVPYSYKYEGSYIVSVGTSKGMTNDVQHLALKEIFITPKADSDSVLKDKAAELLARKLTDDIDSFLKRKNKKRAKLALSMLDNANFEYANNQENFKLIQRITKNLVNNNLTVLEKSPAALVRLAHESVAQVKKNGTLGKRLKQLDYGLRTEFRGPSTPFLYGAKLEGVDDYQVMVGTSTQRDSQKRSSSNAKSDGGFLSKVIGGKGSSPAKKTSTGKNAVKERGQDQTIKSSRPLLIASFDTADYLAVIYILDDLNLVKTGAIYLDPTLNKTMIERTAGIKINARILNKNGVIEWIKDIDASVKDRVVSDYEEFKSKYK